MSHIVLIRIILISAVCKSRDVKRLISSKLQGPIAVSCAKMAVSIEMLFEMLSRVGPGIRGTYKGVWPIEKYCKA